MRGLGYIADAMVRLEAGLGGRTVTMHPVTYRVLLEATGPVTFLPEPVTFFGWRVVEDPTMIEGEVILRHEERVVLG